MKKELTGKNTIVVKGLMNNTSDEVDFDMYNDILGNEAVDEAYEGDGVNVFYNEDVFKYGSNNIPMNINKLRKILDSFENRGCNYVSIGYNCDHPDYSFYGYYVHSASDEEIQKILDKDKVKTLSEIDKKLKEIEEYKNNLLKERDSIK